MTQYTKKKPWKSEEYDKDGLHGNRIRCYEEGPIATCHWELKNRDKGWDEGFVLTSEKLKEGSFSDSICFANPVGLNLVKGTEIEGKLKPGKGGNKCLRL